MGAKSQRKGRSGELELARLLQGYGYDVQPGRAQSYGEVPDLSGLPSVHIDAWADTIRVQPNYPQLSRRNLHALSLLKIPI